MAVFACLPIDWASAIGGAVGRAIGPRIGVSRRALRNLRRAMPENSDADNRQILHGMWDNLGRTIGEYPHLERICDARRGRVELINGERIVALIADGKPGILFGGHLGNWEIGPSTVHRLMGPSLLSVYRAANNPWVDWLIRWRHRTRVAVPKGTEGARALLAHLRDGGHVALLADQKMNDGIAVPFFGLPAMTAPAVARLGARFDCPIVPVRSERTVGARFRVTVEPPIDVIDSGDAARNVATTMAGVNAVIEGWVRLRPEQWLWLHRRWPD